MLFQAYYTLVKRLVLAGLSGYLPHLQCAITILFWRGGPRADPSGFLDGINLYAYVHNNPLFYVERHGLFRESFFSGLQDFEWKSCFRNFSFYQFFESTAKNLWDSPRFQGSMQAIGALAESIFCAGMNSVITGRPAESVTSQLFQQAGISSQNAYYSDTALRLAGNIGWSISIMTKIFINSNLFFGFSLFYLVF